MEIGRQIIHLDRVDSTNNYTANLIKTGQISSGTVILADEQYAGRGQREAQWHSQAGENLTFSIFLDSVNLSVDRQFVLTQLISLSLIDLCVKLGLQVKVKWPNDIYCGEKKIAGVLIENQLQGDQVKSVIVGIGLNVNQEEFKDFKATGLFIETGIKRIPKEILYSYTLSFNSTWLKYMDGRYERLKADYLKNLYQMGVRAQFRNQEGEFSGTITDVLDSGKIVIRSGIDELFFAIKEVQFMH